MYLRIELRAFPPSNSAPRSGAFVFDVDDLLFTDNHSSSPSGPSQVPHDFSPIVAFARAIGSLSPVGHDTARVFLLVGPMGNIESDSPAATVARKPGISVSTGAEQKKVLCHVPSVNIRLSKAILDGLQYLADDVSQWVDRVLKGAGSIPPESSEILGSRFFTRSRSTMNSTSTIKPTSSPALHFEVLEGMSLVLSAPFVTDRSSFREA